MPTTSRVCRWTNIHFLPFFLDFPQIVLKCTNIPQLCAHTYMWVLSVHPLPSLCSMSCPCVVLWHLPERHLSVIPLSTRLNSPFLFSKSFTSKHWATLSFALSSSSMGKSYLMLSSWLVLQNMISFPPLDLMFTTLRTSSYCVGAMRHVAGGVFLYFESSCISVFLLRRLDHNGISGRAAGSSRSGEIFGGIRGKQLQRLIYRQPPAFLQKSSRIWH